MAAADALYDLLSSELNANSGSTLVVVDENVDASRCPATAAGRPLHYLTNRVDLCRALAAAGAPARCSDFDFSGYQDGGLDTLCLRIAKEKAAVHHIINEAGRLLAPGGRLLLIGHKNEGLNTYAAKASVRLGGAGSRRRGPGGVSACSILRGSATGAPLADDEYGRLRPTVDIGTARLFSKPGIYGWQKVDRGSALLTDVLGQWLREARLPANPAVLDLGCGYGYLSVMASRLIEGRFVATDNNLAAVAACAKNFALCSVAGRVVPDDCAQQLTERFDLVLCNPPFHQGFATSTDLTGRFLEAAAAHLAPGGAAVFVVNQFIGLEARARACFARSAVLRQQDGFKVVLLNA